MHVLCDLATKFGVRLGPAEIVPDQEWGLVIMDDTSLLSEYAHKLKPGSLLLSINHLSGGSLMLMTTDQAEAKELEKNLDVDIKVGLHNGSLARPIQTRW